MAAALPLSPLQSLPGSLILDCYSGKVYRATLDQSYLMQFLWNARLDCEKMAALHCTLSCGRDPGFPEEQIIQWISEHVSACHSFDLIQEFLVASCYWSVYPELDDTDMLLPYSSVLTWNAEIPGIKLVTEELPLPLVKVRCSLRGEAFLSRRALLPPILLWFQKVLQPGRESWGLGVACLSPSEEPV